MRYFFDTEFIEDGRTIDLISIGIVSEDGRTLYAVNSNCQTGLACDWVRENVLSQIKPTDPHFRREELARVILNFIGRDDRPEFWAYFADYDWVAFCQLFGRMVDLPRSFPMFCHDLKQIVSTFGIGTLPLQQSREHNALNDARWVQEAFGDVCRQLSKVGQLPRGLWSSDVRAAG